eukprot:TRINITY_DN7095_c0_g1_i1.p1 TRINITY_DN7095_c0_g1~~TRINITY_DN7095_c0_g1_i1.p1  ORF type:complete len:545 (+),score=84.13 TRINITY_DN7095_c0_g1_i1:88-1635(+)
MTAIATVSQHTEPISACHPPATDQSLEVGMRVLDTDGHVGTVRFVGLIPDSPVPAATWIGVEWDDPTRGKYDGSIYGTRYFSCPPGAGSFVRPNKLMSGQQFAEVLAQRYAPDNRPHIRVHCPNILRRDGASGAFLNLRNVDMSKTQIARAGPGLAGLCPNLTTLNLAGNLLTAWAEVFAILNALPKLTQINLSDNALHPVQQCPGELSCSASLSCLILDNTKLGWESVNRLLALFPNLTELYIRNNRFEDVQLFQPLDGLTLLNLSCNRISDWGQVLALDNYSALKTLLLCKNPLENITVVADQQRAPLSGLEVISLDKTNVNSWSSLEALNTLTGLQEVNVADIPLLEPLEESERRKFCIAFLPGITKLNRSPVTTERESAERFFVRYYSERANPPAAYFRLREKHGDLRPLADISLKPVDPTIPVFFEDKPVEGFTLDMSVALWEFIVQMAEFLGKPANTLEVYHKKPYDFSELKFVERRMYSFRILDGDEIHVFCKKPKAPKAKRASASAH